MTPQSCIPSPPSSSILDILLPRPHTRFLNPPTFLYSGQMTVRSADEAGLPELRSDKDAVRPKTTGNNPDDGEGNDPAPADIDEDENAKLDILTYIPHPPLDPLQIHGWDSYKIFENLSLTQRDRWPKAVGAKVFCYRAHGGKIEGVNDIALTREVIKDALKIDTIPIIATPNAEIDGGVSPVCTLVRGISPEKAQELIEKVNPRPTPLNGTPARP